ncbi:MAG: arylsulfatase [Gammaproteobacteria bacterium]
MRFDIFSAVAVVGLLAGCEQVVEPTVESEAAETRPNILLIMADDLGYTDLGSFGGEIRTPNLDALALGGVRLTNYHVGPACSQTRTMIMSGTYTEVGAISDGVRNRYLADNVVALPQLMSDAGYHTYMAGKWHVGSGEGRHPAARGFESSFALMGGAAEHFKVGPDREGRYTENGVSVVLPEDFYSTEVYTDKMIDYLQANEGDGVPFFAWYTPTAPHWPMQVPENYMHRYDGVYDRGYEDLLRRRIQRADEMGVLPPGYSMQDYTRSGHWDELAEEEKQLEARKMELYAAMVENFDYHVSRLVDYLHDSDQFDNTIIIFSSDNGADVSVRRVGDEIDNSLENLGRASSYVAINTWGDVHSAPFKWNKGAQVEGGIRVPAFIHHASLANKGGVDNRFLTAMDLMPTFLELAGSEHPGTEYQGREIVPARGRSFVDLLHSEGIVEHDAGDEATWYSDALYRNEWKLVRVTEARGGPDWELYDLRTDPSETTNLAVEHSTLRAEMISEWTRIGQKAGARADFN